MGRVEETWVLNEGIGVAVDNSEGGVLIKVEICSSYCAVIKSSWWMALGVENPVESAKLLPQNGVNGNGSGSNDDKDPCS